MSNEPATPEYNPSAINIDEIAKQAAAFMLECGSHLPVFQVYGEKKAAIIAAPFGSEQEKQALIQGVGKLLADIYDDIGRVVDIYFIAETWTVRRGGLAVNTMPPSESPDREEALNIAAWHLFPERHGGKRAEIRAFFIEREGQVDGQQATDDGKIIRLVPHTGMSADELEVESPLINDVLYAYGVARLAATGRSEQ